MLTLAQEVQAELPEVAKATKSHSDKMIEFTEINSEMTRFYRDAINSHSASSSSLLKGIYCILLRDEVLYGPKKRAGVRTTYPKKFYAKAFSRWNGGRVSGEKIGEVNTNLRYDELKTCYNDSIFDEIGKHLISIAKEGKESKIVYNSKEMTYNTTISFVGGKHLISFLLHSDESHIVTGKQ